MKRSVSFLLATLLLLSFMLSGCNKSNDKQNDTSENNDTKQTVHENPASDFEYTVDSEKREICINKYIGTEKEVVIPQHIENMPVIAIKGITSATYPNNYEGVFYNTGVVTVVIPGTVRVVGFASFGDCVELTQVIFKKDSCLQSIAQAAFSGCVNLKKIDLSTTELKTIDMYAFKGCAALEEIKFPNTLKQIGEGAFYECASLVDVKIPHNVTKLGTNSFAYCISLERINIPSNLNLNFFDGSALNNVPALSQIVFDEGRENVVGYALIQTDASIEIILPKSVQSFSPLPFIVNPSAHITITFLGDAPEIVDDDTDWFGIPIINYYPSTSNWESFAWKDKYEMRASPNT